MEPGLPAVIVCAAWQGAWAVATASAASCLASAASCEKGREGGKAEVRLSLSITCLGTGGLCLFCTGVDSRACPRRWVVGLLNLWI